VRSRRLALCKGHRLAALFEVLASCGLRRGEALGLMWSDIDFEDGQLVVRRQLLNSWADGAPVLGEPKTANGRRTVELDSSTLGASSPTGCSRTPNAPSGVMHMRTLVSHSPKRTDGARPVEGDQDIWAARGIRWPAAHQTPRPTARLSFADVCRRHPGRVVSKRLGHSTIALTRDT
jgi:integrase